MSFHVFGMCVYGNRPFYQEFANEPELLAFIKKNHDFEEVVGMRVVCGELVEFEPATVVEAFKIKDSQ